MPISLRIVLIVLSIVFVIGVLYCVNHKKMQLQFSLIWLLISLILILIAIFPQIVYFIAKITGIKTASNLVYLMGIIILFVIIINLTIKISKQSAQIHDLIQEFSIYKFQKENNLKK